MRRASRLFLPLAALISIGLPHRAAAQGQDDLTKFRNREAATWESVKNKETASLRKVMTKDYIAVYDDGFSGVDQEMSGIAKMTIRDYRLSDVSVRRLDPLTVLVTSKVVLDGSMGTDSVSGTYNTLTVWHRDGNKWYIAAHTDVKAK
jgi:hypothetical protein